MAANAYPPAAWLSDPSQATQTTTRQELPAIAMWAILATEETPAPKREPVEWMLLSTMPTLSADDAMERVRWYTRRWAIEVWHRMLKTVERLAVALTLYSIIAWHVLYATMLARTDPDLQCTILLSDDEW